MTTTTAQDATRRYFGSLTHLHGEVRLVDDCECTPCLGLLPYSAHRRYSLYVLTDATRELVRLEHVRHESFNATR